MLDPVRTCPSSVLLANLVLGCFVIACSPPPVTSSDRAARGGSSGTTGGSSNGNQGNGNASTGNGTSGGISLPDAAPMNPDAPTAPLACAEEAYKAEAVPLDLMLLVDSSSSMETRVSAMGSSKWELAQSALTNFVRDPRSAGLGIGLQFFPHQVTCTTEADCGNTNPTIIRCRGRTRCVDAAGVIGNACITFASGSSNCPIGSMCAQMSRCADSLADCTNVGQPCPANGGMCTPATKSCLYSLTTNECSTSNYENASVGIAPLPGNQNALLRALLDKAPTGGTPMRAGVEGSLKQLRAHLEKNPGRKGVLVLASDGTPNCSPPAMHGIPAIADFLAMANTGTPAISTYVIGVYTPAEIAMAQPQMDMLARSGGSGQAFVVTANDDLTKKLQETLDAIRGAALSCDFMIPAPKTGSIDYGKVNVRYTPSGGGRADVAYVKSMGNCDPTRGGWYYDVDPAVGTPTRILVCPTTCQQFKKDGSAKVDLLFGCATKGID